MRKWWVIASTVAVLVVVNASIALKEHHLATGAVVYLELAPVDPRSLMQGDYMALNYTVQNEIRRNRKDARANENGAVIVRLDDDRVAHYARLDDGSHALADNEMRIQYRVRENRVTFATNAFFFREGTAQHYEPARYGRFRVNDSGAPLLVSLHDESLNELGAMDRGFK